MQVNNLTQQPQTVKLMYCSVCKIDTVHHRTASGEMVCWCGNVDAPAPTIADRQAQIDYELATGRAELTDGLLEEIAENMVEPEGSDTSWNQQLYDAGFYGAQF